MDFNIIHNKLPKVCQTFINEMRHRFSDRTPFHFIATISLFITIIMSLLSVYNNTENVSDFYPNPGVYYGTPVHDKTLVDKTAYYFSQFTHHTLFLLFFYFLSALFKTQSDEYFKIISPLAITISVLYFYFIFPKQNLNIYELNYYNFYSHFMIIFLIIGEFYYIKGFKLYETFYCLIFMVTGLLVTYINNFIRGVWSYNMLKLDNYKGWFKVCQSILVMYITAFTFYFIKPVKDPSHLWIHFAPFYSTLMNIFVFMIYVFLNPIPYKKQK